MTQDYVIDVAQLFPTQGQWKEQDYFSLPDSMRIVELVDGELIVAPPPSIKHQRVVRILAHTLDSYVQKNQLGEVFFAPIAVRLRKRRIREPDVLFIASANADRIKDTHIEGPPDWVAEVISPGSRHTDEVDKLEEYEEAGVGEYWLLDPEAESVRVYVRVNNSFTLIRIYSEDQSIQSATIGGFKVLASDLFQT